MTNRARAAELAGVRAYRKRRYTEARKLFSAALARAPGDVEARYDRARTYEALRQWPLAERDLRLAAAARPTWINARLQLGIVRYRQKSFAPAARDFDAVLKRAPKNAAVWLDAGVSYYTIHHWKTAADRFHHAVALAPRSGRARLWLGLAYEKLGKRTLAKRELVLASRSRDVTTRRSARTASVR